MPVNSDTIDPRTSSRSDIIRIGLVSDTHYWPQGGAFLGGAGNLQLLGWSDQVADTLIEELNRANLDMAIHLGDLTCGGGTYAVAESEFYDLQVTMHDRLQKLNADVYGLPGNHDCPPSGPPWRFNEERWGLEPGLGKTIDTPGARLVLVNTQGHSSDQIEAGRPGDPIYGWVSDEELARLDDVLGQAGDRPVVLLLHQLLKPWVGDREWARYYPVENADAVLAIMARHGNVRAVFQGHAHMLDVQQLAVGDHPCWFVVIPSTVEYPVGWMDLTLSQDSLHVKLRTLPLPELAEKARSSGDGQDWRAGRPEWRDFSIDLGNSNRD
jgi:3',5'-cyclic AMP phosphodiesterase CpdA